MDKKKIFTPLFIYGALGTAIFSIWAILFPDKMASTMLMAQGYFAISLGWFIKFLPIVFMGILLYLAINPKYSSYKLGGKDAKCDYSTFSWLAMLFTSSVGIGTIYFAVNGPIYAYMLAPSSGDQAFTVSDGVSKALGLSIYQWGPHVWSIFGIAGLVMGYFAFRHGTKFLPGEPLGKAFPKKKWAVPAGKFMNVLALICAAMTIATTLGLGAGQIISGLEIVMPSLDLGAAGPYLVLLILFVICALSSILPTQKGMKRLGDFNVYIAIGIVIFTMVFGPTRLIFETIMQTIAGFIDIFFSESFDMYLFSEKQSFVYDWEVSTIQWWLSWTPFMGVFTASISRGRTFRQFAFAILLIPTAFMLIWLSTFGGIALYDLLLGSGEITANAMANPELTFFAILNELPLTGITTVVTIILIVMFLTTSVVSASLSLSRMTAADDEEVNKASPVRSFVWCLLMSLIAVAAIVVSQMGGSDALNGIRALATTMAFPYLFFFLMTLAAFIKQIRKDFAD